MRVEIVDAISEELLWVQEITPEYMMTLDHDVLKDAFIWVNERDFNYIMREDLFTVDGEVIRFYVMHLKGVNAK